MVKTDKTVFSHPLWHRFWHPCFTKESDMSTTDHNEFHEITGNHRKCHEITENVMKLSKITENVMKSPKTPLWHRKTTVLALITTVLALLHCFGPNNHCIGLITLYWPNYHCTGPNTRTHTRYTTPCTHYPVHYPITRHPVPITRHPLPYPAWRTGTRGAAGWLTRLLLDWTLGTFLNCLFHGFDDSVVSFVSFAKTSI